MGKTKKNPVVEMTREAADAPMLTRTAIVRADSVNVEERTVEVVVATETSVRAYVNWEVVNQVLEISEAACDLTSLSSGNAPVLAVHNRYSLDGVHGVVEDAWIEGKELVARLRFHDDEISDRTWRKIENKILRQLSVGAQVDTYRDITEKGDEIRTLLAIGWTPKEVSVVPIGADVNAVVRSEKLDTNSCVIEREAILPEVIMKNKEKIEDPTVVPVVKEDLNAVRAEAVKADRLRREAIMDTCRTAGLSNEYGQSLAATDVDINAARAAIINETARVADEVKTSALGTKNTEDGNDVMRSALSDVLSNRVEPGSVELKGIARSMAGATLLDICRELLISRGENVQGLVGDKLAERALHSIDDFKILLGNAGERTLRKSYAAEIKTFTPFCNRGSLSNFQAASRLLLGDAPDLLKVNESGEFKRGTFSEGAETIQLFTYGRIIGLTRQAIINDDLNAFMRLIGGFGSSGTRLESDEVWGLVTANGNMSDGDALFSVAHKNIESGGGSALSATSLSTMKKKMRLQTTIDGKSMNLKAKYLIVPAALEEVARQLVSLSVVPSTVGNVNVHGGTLEIIVEARLDDDSSTAWYLAADPNVIDTIEYAYLNGQEGVYTESRNGFDIDGFETKARLDFGAGVIDHRGLAKAVGA